MGRVVFADAGYSKYDINEIIPNKTDTGRASDLKGRLGRSTRKLNNFCEIIGGARLGEPEVPTPLKKTSPEYILCYYSGTGPAVFFDYYGNCMEIV